MDRHIARTIVRNSAGDARVIWSIFSGYHPQGLRESGARLPSKMAFRWLPNIADFFSPWLD